MLNIRSKTTRKILSFFFLNPKEKKYVNELARAIGADPGNTDRALKRLEAQGLLDSETSGKQKYFFLNQDYLLLSQTKILFNSQYGVEQSLKNALSGLVGLRDAYIFGSYAKGGFAKESDIDVLLIGQHSSIEAKKKIHQLAKTLGRDFNIIDMTEGELDDRKKKKDGFIQNIFNGQIIKVI